MKLQFERTPNAVRAELRAPDGCDRIVNVAHASDAFRVFALDVEPGAFIQINALFAFPRVVCIGVERRRGGWRVGVVYWRGASGALAQYETAAASLAEALARCVRALAR
jgi:hypothetical protein